MTKSPSFLPPVFPVSGLLSRHKTLKENVSSADTKRFIKKIQFGNSLLIKDGDRK
ncbi:hypothetical protein [Chryseobacterium sp. CT-SW4]|uniref:hypothetical protein n=1 Tax=Chryseobacterium sp. SW-1 TaxID=3157343 RepID=UPI003B01DBD9